MGSETSQDAKKMENQTNMLMVLLVFYTFHLLWRSSHHQVHVESCKLSHRRAADAGGVLGVSGRPNAKRPLPLRLVTNSHQRARVTSHGINSWFKRCQPFSETAQFFCGTQQSLQLSWIVWGSPSRGQGVPRGGSPAQGAPPP